MITLVFRTIAEFFSFFKVRGVQVQKVLAAVMVSFLLVASNVMPEHNNKALGEAVRERVHETDQADRPKTVGEWNQEARETEGAPGQRLNRIAKESGEAFKQFGSGYVEGVKETARDLRNGAKDVGKDF